MAATTTRRPRRWPRLLLFAALGGGVLAALLVLGLATPPGRAALAGIVERAASTNGITVAIGQLSGWPPFGFGADRIVVSDQDGPFAEIEDVRVDLRAAALLRGRVAVSGITAGRLALARQPRYTPPPPSEDTFALAIERFAVERLELGAGLAGRAAVLTADGAFAQTADGGLDLKVNGTRTDGTQGSLVAAIQRERRGAPLAVDARLEEAANGILASLLGRPAGPGYRLDARTAITGDTVSGTATLASTGRAQFAGRFTWSPVAGAHRLQLTGAGDLAELVPADYADLLSGRIAVDIDADWTPAAAGQALPGIVIRKGALRTATIAAEASGTLASASAAADLALQLRIAKPGGGAIALPSVPARLAAATLNATVARAGDALRLDVAGSVDDLHVAESAVPRADFKLSVTSAGRDPFAGGKLPYTLRAEAAAIDTPAGRIPARGGGPLLLTAEGTFDTATALADTRAALAIEGGRATFAGTLGGNEVRGDATANFADLRPLARFAGIPLSGALEAAAGGTFHSRAGTNLDVNGNTTNLGTGDPTMARLLAGKTRFAGNVTRKTDGTLAIAKLAVDGAVLKATGRAAIGAATIDVALEGRLANLQLLADAASGAATFAVNATGARDGPNLDATVKVDQGTLAGRPLGKASARVQGKPSATGWAGTVALDGNYSGQRMAGNAVAVFDRATGLPGLSRIDLAIGPNRITGALQRTAQGPLSGMLDVAAPELATLAALALVEATGAVNAKVAFAANGARQSLTVKFNGTRLTYATLAAGKLDGDVDIEDAFGTPRIRGNATAAALTVGDLTLDSARVGATVEGAVTKFTAMARNSDLELAGSGSYGPAPGGSVLGIATLTGTAYQLPVRLAAPMTIRIDSGKVVIVDARLAIGAGTVRVDGAVTPALNLTLVADKVPVATANIFAPKLGAEGTLSGRATITGQPSAPAIAWQVDGTGLRAAATRSAGLPPLAIAAKGAATLTGTSVDAKISGAGGLAFSLAGTVPFAGSGLALRAEGTAPLALLALDASRELRLGGTARFNVAASGALAAPALTGSAELVDATIVDVESGFGVAGAQGRIAFDGRQAILRQITGRLAQGGQIVVGGTIDVVADGMPAALTVRVENGRYADGRVVNARFDADLTLDGPLRGNGTIGGTLTLGRTEIQLPEKLTSARTAIDVRHVNTAPDFKSPLPRPQAAGRGGKPGGGSSLRLALAVDNTRGIFVRGFGVDAEFDGSVRVAGTLGDPRATGDFAMRRGRIEILGKRFNLTSGTLTFAGDLVPLVAFMATTATASATVTVSVTGRADDPQIKFSSNPDLPEEEVLSRILFERSVGSLSPLQAAQLIDALAQFTGIGGSGGLFGRIRQATGLDDLDVRQNAGGGTTVGASRSLSDTVRLGVEAGSGTAGRVTIDLELSKNLKARGEAGQDGSGRIGLTFEKEY